MIGPSARRWRPLLAALAFSVLPMSGAAAMQWNPPPTALAPVAPHDPWGVWGYQDVSGLCLSCEFDHRKSPYSNWAEPDSYVVGEDSRDRVVVLHSEHNGVLATRYDGDPLTRTTQQRLKVEKGWDLAALYMATPSDWYVVVSRSNYKESKTRVVMEVRRYDDELKRTGTALIRGAFDQLGVYAAPVASPMSFTTVGDEIVISLAREIFSLRGEAGTHHQVGLRLAIDTKSMTPRPLDVAYVSHSFAQFVRPWGAGAVFVDHGDAYPRAITLTGVPDLSTAAIEEGEGIFDRILLKLKGPTGDNFTGAGITGAEVDGDHALVAGFSLPQGKPVHGTSGVKRSLMPNVFLTSTDLQARTSTFRWLTTFDPTAHKVLVGQPRIVALGSDRFVLMFNVSRGRAVHGSDYYRANSQTRYVLLDGRGNTLASHSWRTRYVPLSQPVLSGDRILCVNSFVKYGDPPRGGTYLTAIDVANPKKPLLLTRGD